MNAGDDHQGLSAGPPGPGRPEPLAPGEQIGELAPGARIGGYRIDALAGRGGMGTVYRATQLALGRTVALKVIVPHFAADPAFRERFRRESRLAASLDHPGVITIYEAGEDAGRLFVSMRFVPGPNLRQLLDAEGPLPVARAVALVGQVASALDAAHALGLVHRDVKPSNVLIERRAGAEHAYLSDFGLVKRMGADAELTGSAGWAGTVDYVAPEQVRGDAVGPRTDIYALGALLYTALSGHVPYPRDDTAAKLYASVNEPLPVLHGWRPDVPPELDAVIQTATAKDPAARFASAGDLARAAAGAAAMPGTGAAAMPVTGAAAMPGTGAAMPVTGAAAMPGTGAGASVAASPAPGVTSPELHAFLGPGVTPAPGTRPPGRPAPRRAGRRWKRAALAIAAAVAVIGATAGTVVALSGGGGGGGLAAAHGQRRGPSGAHAAPGARGVPGVASFASVADGGLGQDHYRLAILDLRRGGPFVTLDFTVTCVSSCDGEFDFAPNAQTLSNEPFWNTPGGVVLIDRAAKKEYQSVTDSQGRPLASQLPSSLSAGQTTAAWVSFAAPPASASSVDVIFPEGGPAVLGVPVSTAPAPGPAQGVTSAVPAPFDKPAGSTDTSGLNLRVLDLVTTVGSVSGSDAQSATRETVTLSADVLFRFGRAALTPAARTVLTQLAARIRRSAAGTIAVTGYTDSIGPDSVNFPLSRARAASVAAALRPLVSGAPVSFRAAGKGPQDPVAPNTKPGGTDNPAGRALNRRVSIGYAVTVQLPAAPPPAAAQPPATGSGSPTVMYGAGVPGSTHSDYQVTVERAVRSGPFVVLLVNVTCQKVTPAGSGCTGEFDFAGTSSVPPLPANQRDTLSTKLDTPAAIYLTDNSGTEYVAVQDAAGTPLTAAVNPSFYLNDTYPLWLYFPAPPAGVQSVNVILPGGAVRIDGVPLAAPGAGPTVVP